MTPPRAGPERPLAAAEFDSLMAPLGPFEPAPRIAVGLSGGADSLALAVLLRGWTRRRRGRLTALTVDHGLRPEAAAEARAVGRQARALGIEHRLLRWDGAKPHGNLQAEARRARRALLLGWCEAAGVLHLALAHQRDDQAETLLLNLARGSGLDGLAAMAPLSEAAEARILRPLLGVPRSRLEALLRRRGLAWIEDPSNRDPRFGRARMRRALPALADGGLGRDRLAAAAGHLARARAALEGEVAALLARAARLDPAGYLRLDPAALNSASEEVALRALARVLACVGGQPYPPRFARLLGLRERLGRAAFRGATLGGCRLAPRGGALLVTRESRGLEALERLPEAGLWDGRYRFRLARGAGRGWRLGALGRGVGLDALAPEARMRARALPPGAREALPAFRRGERLLAVPQLGFYADSGAFEAIRQCRFAPLVALTGPAFTVV